MDAMPVFITPDNLGLLQLGRDYRFFGRIVGSGHKSLVGHFDIVTAEEIDPQQGREAYTVSAARLMVTSGSLVYTAEPPSGRAVEDRCAEGIYPPIPRRSKLEKGRQSNPCLRLLEQT